MIQRESRFMLVPFVLATPCSMVFGLTLVNLVHNPAEHYRGLGILNRSWNRFIGELHLNGPLTLMWVNRDSQIIKEASPDVRILHGTAPVSSLRAQ